MKSGIRHLENHLRKQAWEGSGGLNSLLSSLSGKHFQPSQRAHCASSPPQVCDRRVETQPTNDSKERRHKEGLGEQDKRTKAGKGQGDRNSSARQQGRQRESMSISEHCRKPRSTLNHIWEPQTLGAPMGRTASSCTRQNSHFGRPNTATEQLY